MEQSHLMELLRVLQAKEKEQVLEFAATSYFNNSKLKPHILPLLEICICHIEKRPMQKLDKKDVFAQMFPGKTFVSGKLEKIMVEAHKIVRASLLIQDYFHEKNEFQRGLNFSEIVRRNGLDVRHQQIVERLKRSQEEILLKNSAYFFQQFQLEQAIHKNESLHNQGKGDLNVPNALISLEVYFYLNKIILLNQFLLQQKVANIVTPDNIRPLIESNFIPEYCINESPDVRINYEIFLLLKKNRLESNEVKSLYHLLLFYEDKLDSESLHEFFAYLRNLCMLTISQDYENSQMEHLLHELYIDNLQKGYLHYEGKLSRTRYWMISSNAIRVKDFEWALGFIEKFKNEIRDENESQDIYRLNFANYLFGISKFLECLDYIPSTTVFIDYLLLGKRLELKALYELQSDLLPYKLDAFKMFLSRTSQKLLSESQRKINTDFANFLHQLIHSIPGDPKRSETIVKRLQEKKQAAEWRWLLEKAKALKLP